MHAALRQPLRRLAHHLLQLHPDLGRPDGDGDEPEAAMRAAPPQQLLEGPRQQALDAQLLEGLGLHPPPHLPVRQPRPRGNPDPIVNHGTMWLGRALRLLAGVMRPWFALPGIAWLDWHLEWDLSPNGDCRARCTNYHHISPRWLHWGL